MRVRNLVFVLACLFSLLTWPSFAQLQTGSGGPSSGQTTPPESTGGPDAFGYQYIDSDELDGPVFSFLDVAASGTPITLGDDDEAGPLSLGFDFEFYGTTYTELFVESNGFLSFAGGAGNAFENDCPLVPGSSPGKIIAPYWDDLIADNPDASIYMQAFPVCPEVPAGSDATACTVIQWDRYDTYDGKPEGNISFLGTFQAILYDDGNILFQYDVDFVGDGGGATIAISQDAAGNSLLYACDTPVAVAPQKAILYFRPQPTLEVVCPEGCVGFCSVEVKGMTPRGRIVLMRSEEPAPPGAIVGGGPCTGTELDLADPVKRVTRHEADENGSYVAGPRFFNVALCLDSWQAMDQVTCRLTNVDAAFSGSDAEEEEQD